MKLQLAAVAATGFMLSAASASTLPLQVYATADGHTTLTYSGTSTAGFTGQQTIGSFTVSDITVSTNQPTVPAPSTAAISGLSLNVTNTSSSQDTIDIWVSDNAFTFPAVGATSGMLTVNSTASSFSTSGASTTDGVTLTTFADPTGKIFGTAGPSSSGTIEFTAGTQVSSYPDITTKFNFTPNYPTPYSITDEFAVTLSSHAQTTFTFYTSVTPDGTPSPEPASMAILGVAGAGLLLLGRRHKSVC